MLPAKLPPPSNHTAIDLPDAQLHLWPRAVDQAGAAALFRALRDGIDWRREEILIFGQRRPVPRLVAWHGDPGAAYEYSGTAHHPLPWTDELQVIREFVEATTGHRYNSVLLNLYRDGRDGMGWHADDEAELGRDPAIASLSLGATRRFKLRHRRGNAITALELGDGDLLLMAAPTQHAYVHSVPKTARPVGERINLTFRQVNAVR